MYIYKITNIENNKIYVGQTKFLNIEKRFWSHKNSLSKNKHHNNHLQNSWNKYGEDKFKFEIIEKVLSYDLLNTREIYWIKNLNTTVLGYNILLGGNGSSGLSHSLSAKIKIGEASKNRGGGKLGALKMLGRKLSKEHIEKVRNKITGLKRTKEQKLAISLKKLGKKNPSLCRPVIDNLGNTFKSVLEASEFHSTHPNCVSNILNGWSKQTRNKITFSYLEKVGG
jgi:group I intron endonuclease